MIHSHKPIADQVVVVFGASSGIGRATAQGAHKAGARVVAAARSQDGLDTLTDELGGDRITAIAADAHDLDQVRSVASHAIDTYGRIDTWAHVAGVAEYARFEEMAPAEFQRVIDVDLMGPVHGAWAALPALRESNGTFIVVSSEVARRSIPLLTAYSAAKHGVDGFVEALRMELDHENAGVSVCQILPAAIATPFFENARTRLGVRPSGPPPVYPPERVAEAIIAAAQRPRRDVLVGGAAKLQLLSQRLSRRATDRWVAAMAFRTQRSAEPKGPKDRDGLFEPTGDSRVRGSVSTFQR